MPANLSRNEITPVTRRNPISPAYLPRFIAAGKPSRNLVPNRLDLSRIFRARAQTIRLPLEYPELSPETPIDRALRACTRSKTAERSSFRPVTRLSNAGFHRHAPSNRTPLSRDTIRLSSHPRASGVLSVAESARARGPVGGEFAPNSSADCSANQSCATHRE